MNNAEHLADRAEQSDRIARVEEGDSNRTPARSEFRRRHHSDTTMSPLERDEQAFVHQCLSSPCLNVIDRSVGSTLIDVEGREIIDLHGNGVHAIGFAHPEVVAAVSTQLQKLPFCTRRYTNEPAIRLAEKLGSTIVGGPWRVLFCPSGCSAVSIALKTARLLTSRYKAVGMWGSFHGATLDAISIGGERMFRNNMGPLLPGTLHVHPWVPGRSVDDAVDELEKLFRVEGEIGLVLAEPIRWSTITVPPREYWLRVQQLCREHGALLAFDEIGTCMGRTGRWNAYEHYGISPDIVLLGKSLGGGVMPLAAMLIRAELASPGATGDIALGHFTHEKNPLAAAAGLAAITVIERDGLIERAQVFGGGMLDLLRTDMQSLPGVKAIRGLGMMFAIELESDLHAERVMYKCLQNGVSFKVSSGRVLTLVAPLNMNEEHRDRAIAVICEGIREMK